MKDAIDSKFCLNIICNLDFDDLTQAIDFPLWKSSVTLKQIKNYPMTL